MCQYDIFEMLVVFKRFLQIYHQFIGNLTKNENFTQFQLFKLPIDGEKVLITLPPWLSIQIK